MTLQGRVKALCKVGQELIGNIKQQKDTFFDINLSSRSCNLTMSPLKFALVILFLRKEE